MLRFTDIVFGPIRSRRLGSSLGVNLLPAHGKLCNFDCVYCECGWNRDGRDDSTLPDYETVAQALEQKISECHALGTPIDSITFSGNGEPTLNPCFPQVVDKVLELRDRYFPQAVVSVLSNATTLGNDAVRAALRKVDNPILKMDAVDSAGASLVNRPSGKWDASALVAWLKDFGGDFVLQTMFLKWDEFDTADIVPKWMELVRETSPREIMVYTLDRETPRKDLIAYSCEEMRELVRPLMDEGYNIQIRG